MYSGMQQQQKQTRRIKQEAVVEPTFCLACILGKHDKRMQICAGAAADQAVNAHILWRCGIAAKLAVFFQAMYVTDAALAAANII
jgi:hypothetical protein